MNELDKTIEDCLRRADEYDELAISYREIEDNYVRILGTQYKPNYSTSKECTVGASKNRQLAEWLRELKAYRNIRRILSQNRIATDRYGEVVLWDDIKRVIREVNADEDSN